MLSTGVRIANPRSLERQLHKLRRLNRQLARRAPASKRRAQTRRRLARVHARAANLRRDALHKLILFESFRQGPGSNGGGVGIGLSLVKRFAELHGGTARVEDRPGGGARFVIALPGRITQRDALTVEQSGLRAV